MPPNVHEGARADKNAQAGDCVRSLFVPDGSIEALKWIALLLMTGDHINKYLFNEKLPFLFEAGRLTLPLFVFVLAYNLARPSALARGVYGRIMKRLLMSGLLASPAFIALNRLAWGWWPLNIMFALLVVAMTMYLIERGNKDKCVYYYAAALFVFVIGGSSVEFWWPVLALGLAFWWYCKKPTWIGFLFVVVTCISIWIINRNLWALAALPIIFACAQVDLHVLRLRWFFYAYYPAHLTVLWVIHICMSRYGYLFF
jgi:hypothetical protein